MYEFYLPPTTYLPGAQLMVDLSRVQDKYSVSSSLLSLFCCCPARRAICMNERRQEQQLNDHVVSPTDACARLRLMRAPFHGRKKKKKKCSSSSSSSNGGIVYLHRSCWLKTSKRPPRTCAMSHL